MIKALEIDRTFRNIAGKVNNEVVFLLFVQEILLLILLFLIKFLFLKYEMTSIYGFIILLVRAR